MIYKRNAMVLALLPLVCLFPALIEAEAICRGTIVEGNSTFHSPNYPRPYPSRTNCKWRITVPKNFKIALKFETFYMEGNEKCSYDYVKIFDGHKWTSPVLGRFCGIEIPEEIHSSGNKMSVQFVSDSSTNLLGFEAYYRKVGLDNSTTTEEPPPLVEVMDNSEGQFRSDDVSLKKIAEFYLDMRHSGDLANKWVQHLPKLAMALYLADPGFFNPLNQTGQEIANEISLQLLSKLFMKHRIGTHELSLYINSLILSCNNPRDFYGFNAVGELRKRADSGNYTNPFTTLTLCIAGDEMTMNDVSKVLAAFDAQHRHLWTDTQAMATLATACLATRPYLTVDEADLDRMVAGLKRKQLKNGTVDNVASTALVVQALYATNSLNDFDIDGALKFIRHMLENGSLTLIESINVVPALGGTSLLDINNEHCPNKAKHELEVHNDEENHIQVQCSVFVGNELDFIHTWKMKVPSSYTYYDVLEKMVSVEPEFRVQYSVYEGKPYVSGMSTRVDYAEKGMFWFVYKQTLGSSEEPELVESSPADIPVNENEELILWYRSGPWVSKP